MLLSITNHYSTESRCQTIIQFVYQSFDAIIRSKDLIFIRRQVTLIKKERIKPQK